MTTARSEPGAGHTLHPRRWAALGLLGTAQFMLILDVTVVAVALPLMSTELGLSRETVTWVVAAYTLTFGGFMLLGGRSADLFGAKSLVLGGLACFGLGSLMAGLADSAALLVGGRITQGLGAALLSPAALSVVVRLFTGEERNRALGIWSALGGAGAAVGVLLGGLIVAGPGWPWVFLVNIPVGVVIALGLARVLPALPAATGSRRTLDLTGAVLVTAATGSAIYSLTVAGDLGWTEPRVVVAMGIAAVFYVLFGWRQKSAASPLMDLVLLSRRPVVAGIFVIIVATALMIAIFFLGTFYYQRTAGHGPLTTGMLFLPIALATMIGANLGGRLVGAVGARALGAVGMVIAAAGLLVPALWTTTLTTTIGVSLGAFGIGALFVVASATALGHIAPEEAGIASGLLSTFHEFGAALGVASVSSIAALSLVGGGDSGYQRAFGAVAAAALVAAVVGAALIPARSTGRQ